MECYNQIYRLLVLSFIILILIGIFERYGRIVYGRFVAWLVEVGRKIKVVFRSIVIRLSNYLSKKIQKWSLGDKIPSLLLLSPEIDVEAHQEYINRLKAAIDNPNVHNIALSGAYGSGKSSILKTFKSYYTEYKTIDVSLASFGDVKEDDGKDENKLEYRILQQLFYQVKMSDISESRFGRIERTSLTSKLGVTVALCLLAISYVCLFKADWLEGIFPNIKEVIEHDYTKIIALVVFAITFFLVVFQLVHLYKKLGIKNLGVNFSSTKLELEDKKNVTVMNRYLDEIVYLFQKKKFEVVFFEDLDRFENILIFTKLRELNQILNQSEEIKQRVVFVYALCDNVFATPEERTKFFDYIIPVIPYVNVSNSGDLFKRSFKKLQIPNDKLSSEFLTDISHFVTDTRVVKNMVNEFTLYQSVLDPKLDLQHLLAIILYKNIYPKDFCLLHQGKGLVYGVFASVPLLKKERNGEIQKRMMVIDEKIKEIQEEVFVDVSELNAVVVAHFLKQEPNDEYWPVDNHGNRIEREQLFDDSNVALILQGNFGFQHYRYQYHPVSSGTMATELGADFNYDKRKSLIEKRHSEEVEKLYKERASLEKEQAYLNKLQLHDVAKSISDVFEYVDSYQALPDKAKKQYNVLGYLLKEGYIDEDYFYYISIFQEGRLTPQDNEFLLSVKFDEPKELGFKLTEFENIISNLKVADFDKKAIVNFNLLQYLLEREDIYADKCDAIINVLTLNQNIDSIYSYVNNWKCVDVFIKRLTNWYPNIWKDVYNDISHSYQEKKNFLSLVFAYAELDVIRRMNDSYPFAENLNEDSDFLDVFSKCDENKGLSILDAIYLKVKTLGKGKTPLEEKLLTHIYETDKYQLNLANIRFVANEHGLKIDGESTSVYSLILESQLEPLKKYIKHDINEFAENVVREKEENFVSTQELIGLLKNENVKFETKVDLISNKDFVIDNEKGIDVDLMVYLYTEDKVKPTLDNVVNYYELSGNKLDEDLIEFMNKHRDELCWDIKNKKEVEAGYSDFIPAVIQSKEVNKAFSYAILDNVTLGDIWKNDLSILNDEQLFYVLLEKFVALDNMTVTVANKFMRYFMNHEYKFDYHIFVKAIELSDNDVLKALVTAKFIDKRMLHFKDIPNCLAVMGDAFEIFTHVGENIKVTNAQGMKQLVDALHSVKYLGKVTLKGNEVVAKVLKH